MLGGMSPDGHPGMQSGRPAPAAQQEAGTHRSGPHRRIRQVALHQPSAVSRTKYARKIGQSGSIKTSFLLKCFQLFRTNFRTKLSDRRFEQTSLTNKDHFIYEVLQAI